MYAYICMCIIMFHRSMERTNTSVNGITVASGVSHLGGLVIRESPRGQTGYIYWLHH